jgi:hypothetical protein
MFSTLKRNIYDLQDYGFQSEMTMPPEEDPLAPIRYSCLFWADHLCSVYGEEPKYETQLVDDGTVLEFLRKRFLYWLESLSLLGKLSDGVKSIRKLLRVVQVYHNGHFQMQILSTTSHNQERDLSLLNS